MTGWSITSMKTWSYRHHPLFMTLVQRLWDDLDNEDAPQSQADPPYVVTEPAP